MRRVILDVVILICVIQGWWFIAVPLTILGLLFWPLYIEVLIAGVMYDSLFGMNGCAHSGPALSAYAGTLYGLIALFASYFLRKTLR